MDLRGDIKAGSDIQKLVGAFYAKVNLDTILSPIFNEVAKVDWDEHLPHIERFWSMLLFKTKTFQGQPFPKHAALELRREHFQRWVELFVTTVDELFTGAKAEEAKGFARSIADSFQMRLGLLSPLDFQHSKLI